MRLSRINLLKFTKPLISIKPTKPTLKTSLIPFTPINTHTLKTSLIPFTPIPTLKTSLIPFTPISTLKTSLIPFTPISTLKTLSNYKCKTILIFILINSFMYVNLYIYIVLNNINLLFIS